jgi:hypothetical protein
VPDTDHAYGGPAQPRLVEREAQRGAGASGAVDADDDHRYASPRAMSKPGIR